MNLTDCRYVTFDGWSARRKIITYKKQHTEQTQIFMPRVGFEPKIQVFERAKAFRAVDSAATVIYIK
jgi:hypothetical protein